VAVSEYVVEKFVEAVIIIALSGGKLKRYNILY